ncbi:MAG: Crp/Fnr family transcriptional regulator [Sedimenticola thiotaurini]|uniref:Crp/Fnr family transcriptional regulator n=1 Tax=Sedimenticola thiotaurini TaxID=1543721 RepID=A0A558CWR3_9GAMM|nr:MAG: Crp/Fnr family transcriptional regulator [Sedimenticola thiotaurini]
MQHQAITHFPNRLLANLPYRVRQQILAGCDTVDLTDSDILEEPDEPIRYVYFPTKSSISMLASVNGHSNLEVGLVGDEGMIGTALILGVAVSSLRAVVRGEGSAIRMTAACFRRELKRSAALGRELDRYLYVVMDQFAQAVTCSRFHLLESRLARWLLMTHDRAHSDMFHVTHESLSLILGVRRVGVTKAATALQNKNLISYTRGDIVITDRKGLEKASCECYANDKAAYERIMSK